MAGAPRIAAPSGMARGFIAPAKAVRSVCAAAAPACEACVKSAHRAVEARQREGRHRAAVGGVGQRDAPVVQLGNLLDEGQAEAGASFLRMRARERIELLEDLVLGVVGD